MSEKISEKVCSNCLRVDTCCECDLAAEREQQAKGELVYQYREKTGAGNTPWFDVSASRYDNLVGADGIEWRILYTHPSPALAFEREQEQAVDKYQSLCAAVWQAAGAFNMPSRILDALSDAANGNIEQRRKTDDLLPCNPEEQAGVTDELVDAAQDAYVEVYEAEFILGEPRLTDNASHAMRAALEAVAPMLRGVPAGWKLVPIEPTLEMTAAPATIVAPYTAKLVYQRMLAASPAPGES